MDDPTSKIITFYSYKGGVGRTMALANVGLILASRNKNVLMIDWDLEAPGLHNFFAPFLYEDYKEKKKGLIDFFMRFQDACISIAVNEPAEIDDEWYKPLTRIEPFIIPISINFVSNEKVDFFERMGDLHLLKAGQLDENYGSLISTFNWDQFYQKFNGGAFLEAFKESLKKRYDYILIDSRTGYSDTSGICTIQMPDILVLLSAPNSQGIDGVTKVAEGRSCDLSPFRKRKTVVRN